MVCRFAEPGCRIYEFHPGLFSTAVKSSTKIQGKGIETHCLKADVRGISRKRPFEGSPLEALRFSNAGFRERRAGGRFRLRCRIPWSAINGPKDIGIALLKKNPDCGMENLATQRSPVSIQ